MLQDAVLLCHWAHVWCTSDTQIPVEVMQFSRTGPFTWLVLIYF